MKRPTKDEYYMNIAKEVSKRSTCTRRRFGAVIVSKSDRIVSTGYNGAIRKALDCLEIGKCMRDELHIKPGERYELCKAFHAEQNAILGAGPTDRKDSVLYLYGEHFDGRVFDSEPCMMCRRAIVQGEISMVKAMQSDGTITVLDVKSFIDAEDHGKNFPREIVESKEFTEYQKKIEGMKR
jgi:dCMP deaminase